MTVSTKDISELRARTGAGIGDCKKALEEAGGDMEKAGELLRKKGIAKAEKRAGRTASQGLVLLDAAADGSAAALLELDCETDFVARTDDFGAMGTKLVARVRAALAPGHWASASDADVLGVAFEGSTIGEAVQQLSAKTGEAVSIRRAAHFAPAGGAVGAYLHFNRQVGVIVEVAGASGADAVALGNEVALHIASADPIGVTTADIPAELLERERRIAEEQVAAEGKPENIRAKIVDGKVRKFAAERALLEQPFVKDESKTVGQLVAALKGASVVRFARFKVGEG
ncbi:MAG: translation elongation factor Ts [Gemmatimonadales bacterium]|nr:translation elongation factor Ts [Gemmatimonadales bacterium]